MVYTSAPIKAPATAPSTQNFHALSRRMRSSREGGENNEDINSLQIKHSSSPPIPERRDQFANVILRYNRGKKRAAIAIMDSDHLRPAAIVCHHGLARRVQTKVCPGLAHIFDLRKRRDSRPEIVIHCKIKRRV